MRARHVLACAVLVVVADTACMPAGWGARAIVCPYRRAVTITPRLPFEAVTFRSGDIELEGWLFHAQGPRRGLIVYLHGITDTRQSGLGVARRLVPRGYDVLLFDGRAHGESGGRYCTYGVLEKRDLSRALDAVGAKDALVIGVSLGGAVAIQAAAVEPRVRGVVALASYSDLVTVVHDRAPRLLPERDVKDALARVQELAGFDPADASPVTAAPRVEIPVLLIHGARDHSTPPRHSRRIYRALGGPRELTLIEDAGHNDILAREATWEAIDQWLSARERP